MITFDLAEHFRVTVVQPGATAVALDDLQQIATLVGRERLEAPIVEDEQPTLPSLFIGRG